MPITVYVGVPRSGKTYSIVKDVIVPAVESGRRVITNIDGISRDAIEKYLESKGRLKGPLGEIVSLKADQLKAESCIPHDGFEGETIVKGGDLLVVDEAQMLWGYGDKLSMPHLEFLTQHGHYVDEVSKRCCDLVLATQDTKLINRKALGIVNDIFRIERKDELGLNSTFLVHHFKGCSTSRANFQQTRGPLTYEKEIFDLYHSFQGGVGVVQAVDANVNQLKSLKFKLLIAFILIVGGLALWGILSVFSKKPETKPDSSSVKNPASVLLNPINPNPSVPVKMDESDWRVSGHYLVNGVLYVHLKRGDVYRTLIQPKGFYIDALRASGQLDGVTVSNWTGAVSKKPLMDNAK